MSPIVAPVKKPPTETWKKNLFFEEGVGPISRFFPGRIVSGDTSVRSIYHDIVLNKSQLKMIRFGNSFLYNYNLYYQENDAAASYRAYVIVRLFPQHILNM